MKKFSSSSRELITLILALDCGAVFEWIWWTVPRCTSEHLPL